MGTKPAPDTNQARCPLWVDIVAIRFLVPERGIIFQERVRMENIDSRIPSFGFCYCLSRGSTAHWPTFATQSTQSGHGTLQELRLRRYDARYRASEAG